ncbi:DUF937 domain-containing protein [Nonomuraea sp. MCN248]|uniref:DUF937 domain-containing protein n=1 Tax=Nonomuraea corallina TaxID=2989783 RepID=A0ABT4SKR1_9ACTN|nr:DUF937 domain-containing protein [Nonomuraea corallina]MDA0637590.1 DUF937 domain-containing protein [Nonomuraea corallina]
MRLTDRLLAELGDPGLEQIGGMLATDPGRARDVIAASAATIVGGMARDAEHPDGAEALRTALDEHTDADPFNGDVASLIRDGQNILAHVLGGQGTETAAYGLARLSGLDPGAVMRLLALLAPMVMSLLAVRAEASDMSTEEMTTELARERATLPGELAVLLADAFGDLPEPHTSRDGWGSAW